MTIQSLYQCPEFTAGDHTLLRELLHPAKLEVDLRYSLAHARVRPGNSSTPHRLATSEVYYILAGRGRMNIDGEAREVSPGDMIYIPPAARQFIEALGTDELVFLCIVDPAWREEDEIVESASEAPTS